MSTTLWLSRIAAICKEELLSVAINRYVESDNFAAKSPCQST
jgi:hypothetical protein